MRNLILILLFLSVFIRSYSQKQTYWQQQANYSIQVQLDDILNSIDGYEKIVYTNNSPDTLSFIWFNIWPNAYKDDKTAFSEQLLRNGRTDFYFANEENRGYISHLYFKVNDIKADTEQHPQYIDVVKVKLPEPLAPGQSATITTPFHVKLPYNFSRGGHVGQSYQATQWYPKPAVYDSKGWHPMPYLDQGEFYSEFGNYDVQITLPSNYIVAASGVLEDTNELKKLLSIASDDPTLQTNYTYYKERLAKQKDFTSKGKEALAPRSSSTNKTLHYQLNNAHDFAWFASKQYLVAHDTVQLQSKTVDVFTYYPPWNYTNWKNSIGYAKAGLKYYDKHVGSYPYPTANVVGGPKAIESGGMEYPSITLISTQEGGKELDETIAHELGHNWFYGSLATNERDHAWMDEGINTFYQNNYTKGRYSPSSEVQIELSIVKNLENIHKNQPIDLTSDSFTVNNYGLFVYEKTADWMEHLKQQLGSDLFEKSMKNYYSKWQFKHPYPADFKQSIEETSNKNIDGLYSQLFTTAAERLAPQTVRKPLRLTAFFPTKNTDKYQYISVAPMLGYNAYDNLMVGGIIHNYQLPLSKFNFLAIPLYAIGTNRINYYIRASYRILLNKGFFDNININSSVSSFSYEHVDVVDSPYYGHFNWQYLKIDPTIRLNIRNKHLTSPLIKFIQFKAFYIQEGAYNEAFKVSNGDTSHYVNNIQTNRHLAQLRFNIENYRALYPYNADLTIDANETFLRAGLTANYFFTYPEGKNHGLNVRLFAGKFFHLTQNQQLYDSRYYLTLTGPRGNSSTAGAQDYTYSNYFIGRGESEGAYSQQLMERDGFFKVGTELQGDAITGTSTGTTDNWLSAINFTGNIPNKINPLTILPFEIPIKFFVDLGTYAEAWNVTNTGSHFLYDAGLQLSLFHNCANLYVPFLYSKVYRDYYQSIFPGQSFAKSISFSIDIQRLKLYQFTKGIPL